MPGKLLKADWAELKKKMKQKQKCGFCGVSFIKKAANQLYCGKPECRKFSKLGKEQKAERLAGAERTIPNGNPKEMAEVHQYLYKVSNGQKIVNKLASIATDVMDNMNTLKLDTYSEAVKAHCFEIMEELSRFLRDQLRKDKVIIDVKTE